MVSCCKNVELIFKKVTVDVEGLHCEMLWQMLFWLFCMQMFGYLLCFSLSNKLDG